MIIKNLNLKNFGSIKKANLEFQKGFNLIGGANGQGKSFIIRAIAYMLINKTFSKIEDYCNWNSDTFALNMLIEYQNKQFKFDYQFNKSINKELSITDLPTKKIENFDTPTDVVNELKKYFDPSLCEASILSFQGEMDIVQSKDASRRELLKNIYNLDFKHQIKFIENEQKALEEGKIEIDKRIFFLQNKQYDEALIDRLPFSEVEYTDKLSKRKITQNTIDSIQREIDLYNSKKENISIKKIYLDKIQTSIDKKKEYRIELMEYIGLKHEAKDEQSIEINNLKLIYKETDWEHRLNILQEELDKIVIERIPKFDEEHYEELKDAVNETKRNLDNSKEHYEFAKNGVCPTCKRDFKVEEIEGYEAQVITFTDLFNQIKNEYDEITIKKKECDELLHKQEADKNNRNNLIYRIEKEKESIEKEKKASLEKIDILSKNLDSIQNEIDRNTKLLDETNKELKNLREEQDINTKEIIKLENELPDDTPIVDDSLYSELEELTEQIEHYETIKTRNEINKQKNEIIKKEKEEDVIKLEKEKKKLDSVVLSIQNYIEAITILKKEFPNYVISTMVGDIEFGMNQLLNKAYEGRYNVKLQESKNGLKILYGPKDTDISALSGGAEQNLFNLGFKNAFTYISGLKILFLDEADNFMDNNVATAVFTAINEMIQNKELDQVFVITHKDATKQILKVDFNCKSFEVSNGLVEIVED